MKPRKELGQHWLHDRGILEEIVITAKIETGDYVLEVGPGLGTLTEFILAAGAKVVAVEYDRKIYESLKKEPGQSYGKDAEKLELVNEDILKFDLTQLPSDYKVVANIPYYLTSNLIRVMSESSNPPLTITLLIQKEVAERLCAEPGKMSLLSVSAGMYYVLNLGSIVPAKMFTPPPKVDSRVVHMSRRTKPLFDGQDKQLLFLVVKAGFSNRRKTLQNSLSAGLHISKAQASKHLEQAAIDPGARPQELTLSQWINITHTIKLLN